MSYCQIGLHIDAMMKNSSVQHGKHLLSLCHGASAIALRGPGTLRETTKADYWHTRARRFNRVNENFGRSEPSSSSQSIRTKLLNLLDMHRANLGGIHRSLGVTPCDVHIKL